MSSLQVENSIIFYKLQTENSIMVTGTDRDRQPALSQQHAMDRKAASGSQQFVAVRQPMTVSNVQQTGSHDSPQCSSKVLFVDVNWAIQGQHVLGKVTVSC